MQKNSFLKFLIINISITLISSCSTVTQNQNVLFNPDIIEAQSQNDLNQNIVHGIYQATVTQLLPDDTQGLKHELFMIKIKGGKYDGKVAKIAHDIGYAPYVPVQVGSQIEAKGDLLPDATPDIVLHWTHHSDNSKHPNGYIKLQGRTYQ